MSLIKKRKQDSTPAPVVSQDDSDSDSSSGSDMEVTDFTLFYNCKTVM